jgi:hypothetical protein
VDFHEHGYDRGCGHEYDYVRGNGNENELFWVKMGCYAKIHDNLGQLKGPKMSGKLSIKVWSALHSL